MPATRPMRRVFLVGCPRSGTTLLQAMLASHSEITSFPETHFFDRMYWGKKAFLLRGARGPSTLRRIAQLLAMSHVPTPRFSIYRRPYELAYLDLLDAYAAQQSKGTWLEKTPAHVHFIPQILGAAPEAFFIHLIRDGRAVIASLQKAWENFPQQWSWAKNHSACVARWNRSILDSVRWLSYPNHLMLRYEALASSPEPELNRICRFLGIRFEPAMLKHASATRAVVAPNEPWKSNSSERLQLRGLEEFKARFDEQQQWLVESQLLALPTCLQHEL